MTNPFYVRGEGRAARVAALFGAIASRYDLLNDIQSLGMHRVWKRRLISLAKLKPGDSALDVCCGTGDLTFRLARQCSQVTGIDFSDAMLAVARQRATKTGSTNQTSSVHGSTQTHAGAVSPKFVRGDAMRLPFSENQFAAVTVGYGLRNLEDWREGLREMVRVSKPGGRILVLDFGKPRNALLRTTYFLYLRLLVPLFGLLFCGNASAYAYILESLQQYPAQEGVAASMRELGLDQVVICNLMGGMMSINVGVKVVAKPTSA